MEDGSEHICNKNMKEGNVPFYSEKIPLPISPSPSYWETFRPPKEKYEEVMKKNREYVKDISVSLALAPTCPPNQA